MNTTEAALNTFIGKIAQRYGMSRMQPIVSAAEVDQTGDRLLAVSGKARGGVPPDDDIRSPSDGRRDWFHKYAVTRVTATDPTGGAAEGVADAVRTGSCEGGPRPARMEFRCLGVTDVPVLSDLDGVVLATCNGCCAQRI